MNAQPPRSIIASMAARYGMEPAAFEQTLRATVVPTNATREEFAAFLLVASEYGLNPITKEIFAFPKKGGGIQPIVGVDGWANILNSHPNFDGMDFVDHVDGRGNVVSITCRIHRKDRTHPIEATEYLIECSQGTAPWKQWPRRMLRHKAMIQAARYAFGFAGIIDPDEYDRRPAVRDITPPSTSLVGRLASMSGGPKPPPSPPEEPEPEPEDEGEELPLEPAHDEDGVIIDEPAPDDDGEPIDEASADYKRGVADRTKGIAKCLNSEIRNSPVRMRHWQAGYDSGEPA